MTSIHQTLNMIFGFGYKDSFCSFQIGNSETRNSCFVVVVMVVVVVVVSVVVFVPYVAFGLFVSVVIVGVIVICWSKKPKIKVWSKSERL